MGRIQPNIACVILVSLTCGFLLGQGALELTSTFRIAQVHTVTTGVRRYDDRLRAIQLERHWQVKRDLNQSWIPSLQPWRVPRELQNRLSSRMYTNTSATLLLQPQTNPLLYENPKTGQKAFICIPAKVGTTQWKQLLFKAMGIRWRKKVHSVKRIVSRADWINALRNESIHRFMFVRNPYSRLLSGYLDKIERLQETKRFPYGYHNSTGFEGFVKAIWWASRSNPGGVLRRGRGVKGAVDAHFLPQHLHCSLPRGFRYDYYLKLEQMDEWYEPFVKDVLGIQSLAQHFDSSGCFYSSPGYNCSDMFTDKPRPAIHNHLLQRNSTHSTQSNNKLKRYYDPTSVSKVNRVFKRDLEMFGYQAWDGVDPDAYLKKCSANPLS